MTAQPMDIKRQKNFRLTPEAQKILAALSHKLGIPENAVLEITLRNVATQQNIQVN